MEATEDGIVIEVRPVQLANADSPIESTPSEITTEFKYSQYLKVFLPMVFTDEGIVTAFRILHSEKADSPIDPTPSAMFNETKFKQLLNALIPIKVTDEGIETALRPEFEKANSPMV